MAINLGWTANSTSPIYDFANQNGDRNISGGDLATVATVNSAFSGYFAETYIEKNLNGGFYNNYEPTGLIIPIPSTNKAYISGAGQGYQEKAADGLLIVNIPSLSTSLDPADWNAYTDSNDLSTYHQAWNATGLTAPSEIENNLGGAIYDGRLFLQYGMNYASANSLKTFGYYDNALDITTANYRAYFALQTSIDETSRCFFTTDWLTEIPSTLRSQFNNHTHVFGGGDSKSAGSGTAPTGPTLFTGDLSAIGTAGGHFTVSEVMSWPFTGDAQESFAGKYLATKGKDLTAGASYIRYNVDPDVAISSPESGGTTTAEELASYVAWDVNAPWTRITKAYCGFFIPNTYTYCVVGRHGGKASGAAYKPPHYQDGPAPVSEGDQYNYCWLFDIRDLNSQTNPNDTLPYAHGELGFLNNLTNQDGNTPLMNNANFDTSTGKLYMNINNMSGATLKTGAFAVCDFGTWT